MTGQKIAVFLASTAGAITLLILVFWSLVWKGIALWKAARRSSTAWYIVLLVLNTAGILEIIYIFLVAPRQEEK